MPAPQKRRPRLRPHGHTRAMLTSATCALGRLGLDPQSLPPRPTLLLLPPPRPTHTPTGALPSAKPSPLAFNVLLITVLYGRTSRAPYSCDREQKVLAWGGRGLPRGPQGVGGGALQQHVAHGEKSRIWTGRQLGEQDILEEAAFPLGPDTWLTVRPQWGRSPPPPGHSSGRSVVAGSDGGTENQLVTEGRPGEAPRG